jgi:hypothetical protein
MPEPIVASPASPGEANKKAPQLQPLVRAKLRTTCFFVCAVFLVAIYSILVAETAGASSFWSIRTSNGTVTSACASVVSLLVQSENSSSVSSSFPCSGVATKVDSVASSTWSTFSETCVASLVVFTLLVLPSYSAVYWLADATTGAALRRGALVAASFSIALAAWLGLLIAQIATAAVATDSAEKWRWPLRVTIGVAALSFLFLLWAIKRLWLIVCGAVQPTFPDGDEDSVESSEKERAEQRRQDKQRRKEARLRSLNADKPAAARDEDDGDEGGDAASRQPKVEPPVVVTYYTTRNGIGRGMLLLIVIGALHAAALSSWRWIDNESSAATLSALPARDTAVFWSDSSASTASAWIDDVRLALSNISALCDGHESSAPIFVSSLNEIQLGLNGASLACATLLSLAAVLGWTRACVAPFALSALLLTVAAVATLAAAASSVCEAAQQERDPIRLGWAVWLQVAGIGAWLVVFVVSILVQEVSDRVES